LYKASPPHSILRRASALLLFFALCFGLSGCRGDSGTVGGRQQRAEADRAQTKASPEVKLYVDEAQLQKPYAVLSGMVENGGDERLENLVVEVELRHRGNADQKETREVPVVPEVINPGEKGSYLLKVKSEEWAGFRVVRLKLAGRANEIAFQSLPGKQRPPERVDATRTISEEAPKKRSSGGEDFINTPDTPISVP
jgi:hypothetical protein